MTPAEPGVPATAWTVEPSGPLRGEVRVAGSKNAITKHMVAAIMGRTPSTIRNVPAVGDVGITTDVLQSLGVGVELDGDAITIDAPAEIDAEVSQRYSGLNRIPILLLGPLLHLRHEAFVPVVGGDRIGARPVDFHVEALRSFGAEVVETEDGVRAKVTGRMRGTQITLPYPSVGATETVLLTAALAEGRTVLNNAATEPEIIELALFLQRMGARVELTPGRRFVIDGVDELHGATSRLEGDRLEAFSYLVAGLVTGGQVRVAGCRQERMVTAISTLQRMGAELEINDDWISAHADHGLKAIAIHTDTHPGFMTDWQSPLFVLMTQAEGMSVLHETVFEDRIRYPATVVQAMGGEIELFETCLGGPACRFQDGNAVHSAVVRGVSKLHGAHVEIPDLRAGFSGVIAAAVAEGPSVIEGVHHLERGYNRPLETLQSLGLKVRRTDANPAFATRVDS
ncbi:MAG TPA: UDP-N-acetylglucosamine 1-carboxyvinyltransferase [Acidimicrobiales bacterium]|nr:UDP-N-acetylglucosamine 1-carboxyvinyltransferase [Acidimicrobiales bacterium]